MYYESSGLSFDQEPLSRNERNTLRYERSQRIHNCRQNIVAEDNNSRKSSSGKKNIIHNVLWIVIIVIVSIISMFDTFKIISKNKNKNIMKSELSYDPSIESQRSNILLKEHKIANRKVFSKIFPKTKPTHKDVAKLAVNRIK